jgi:hypothetical protein
MSELAIRSPLWRVTCSCPNRNAPTATGVAGRQATRGSSITDRIERWGIWRVRGNGDATELAGIQPVHVTTLAGVDDHVPGSLVEMTEHGFAARGTVKDPIARMLARRKGNPKRTYLTGTHRVDNGRKAVHVDQHAEAASAAEQRMSLESAARERSGTGRAHARGLVQQLQVLDACRYLLLTAAMLAHKEASVAVEPQRCSAVVTGCHDRIIGKGRQDR